MIQGLRSQIGVFLFRRIVLFEDTLRLRYDERQIRMAVVIPTLSGTVGSDDDGGGRGARCKSLTA